MQDFEAILLLAGEAPSLEQWRKFGGDQLGFEKLLVVAADGGYALALSYGLKVDVLLGDMDSLAGEPEANSAGLCLRYPRDKAESDRVLALQYLEQQGIHRVLQVGGGGMRMDHLLAIIYDYRYRSFLKPQCWLSAYERCYYLQGGEELALSCQVNDLVSLFPLEDGKRVRLKSEGLLWPLQEVDWSALPYSLSNWTNADRLRISVESGACLLLLPYSCS